MYRLACIVVALWIPSVALGFDYVLTPRWRAGGVGSGPGEYGTPESVAIDSLGRVVVTDKGRMMLHVYAHENGQALFDVGRLGTDLGEFDRPNGIAVDARGRVLVVEQSNRRVQLLDRDYQPLGAFGKSSTSSFVKAMGIALDRQGHIYVTDEARADIQVFDANGRFLWRFGDAPRLDRVESIEVDTLAQRIFVCDEGRATVNTYDMQGRFTGSFGTEGSAPGEFGDVPNAVRVDGAGRIYINDQGNSRINVYRPDTRFLAAFHCSARAMESADGMALSETHNLLVVADQGNNRVLAFDLAEFQCRLARDEIEPHPAAIASITAAMDSLPLEPGGLPAYVGGRIDLEARGSGGDPALTESTVVHVRTSSDPRGLFVTLVETGPATDAFRAHFELASRSDRKAGRLGAAAGDTLRLHLGGEPDLFTAPVVLLPLPVAHAVQIEGSPTGRIGTDSPSLLWEYRDPAARRRQSAAQARIRLANGDLVWEGAPHPSEHGRLRCDAPPLPRGTWLRAEVRVASGSNWGEWVATPVCRTTPPAILEPVGLDATAVLRAWPPEALQARIAPGTDTDILRAVIEIERQGAPPHRVPASFPFTGVVRALGPLPSLGEDERARWRVVLRHSTGRVEGPWWTLCLNADPATPNPPRRDSHGLAPSPADSLSSAATGAYGDPTRSGTLESAAGMRLHVAPAGDEVVVELFDVRGRLVRSGRSDGNGMWNWDGRDARGVRLPRGLYFVRTPALPAAPPRKLLWRGR